MQKQIRIWTFQNALNLDIQVKSNNEKVPNFGLGEVAFQINGVWFFFSFE